MTARRRPRPHVGRPSSGTRPSSASRSTASSGPPRRCSAPARRRTTARRRTRHVCPVCLGLPGALPTINRRAVEHVLATGPRSRRRRPAATRWDRKNYFYPDLPKGYQISQYDLPLASRGRLTFETSDGPVHRRRSPAPTSRRTPPSSSTRTDADGRQGQPRRLQPLRRAADGDRHRARHPDRRAGAPLRRGAPAAAALDRRVGRRHGARPDAGRGERLAPAARHRAVRDAGRGQEHELVPLRRAGDRRSRSSARPRRSTPASRSSRRPAAGRRSAARRTGCGSRRRPTTTATSPSRTCRRSTSTRPGWPRSGRGCPSCPRRAARATGTCSGCVPTTPRSSSPTGGDRAVRGDARPPTPASSRSRSRTGSPGSTCAFATRPADPVDRRAGGARGDHRAASATAICHAGAGHARSSRSTSRRARPRRHRRRARASARSPTRCPRRGRRRGPRREPGGRRGLPRRQGPGGRLPRRPGHEGDRAARRTRRSSRRPSANDSTRND